MKTRKSYCYISAETNSARNRADDLALMLEQGFSHLVAEQWGQIEGQGSSQDCGGWGPWGELEAGALHQLIWKYRVGIFSTNPNLNKE